MRYLIGIDCGATNTEVVLYSYQALKNGHVQGKSSKFRFPAVNYNLLGLEETVEQLGLIIKKSAGKKIPGNVDYIIAGISGARNEEDRIKIKLNLRKILQFKNIEIYPDTLIAFSAAFEPHEKNRGIIIAGTGSVFYYLDSKDRMIRVGGWGRYIGDEGSGYWIARTALHMVTRHYDGRIKRKSISEKLAQKLDKELNVNRHTIIEKVYHNRFEISEVTKLVFDCAESGDKACKEIIREAAENLSEHFIPLKNEKATIALCGSLFSREKLLENYLRKITRQKYPGIKLVKPKLTPVWGAIKIAIQLTNKTKKTKFARRGMTRGYERR